MTDTPWLAIASRYVGLAEIPGRDHAPTITRWLTNLKAWWRDDETPWCGTFVAHCLKESGCAIPKHWYRAKAYLDCGEPCGPVIGAVVIYERAGGGHVGFVVGIDQSGRIMTLGGNQGNRVSIAPFDSTRVLGYRWPTGTAPLVADLPVLNSTEISSTSEA